MADDDRVRVRMEVKGWRGRRMKVLVADHAVVTRRLLETALKSWNYEICSATDGTEALCILESGQRPVIALLDWLMPERDGPEVCRVIRARHHGSVDTLPRRMLQKEYGCFQRGTPLRWV
jgi:CheY-like chemotaxis protein